MHTAMAAFHGKQVTADGFEFAFALQYFARAALNRLLIDSIASSRDGRIVHVAGHAPTFIMPDLDDLQFERRKWSFFKSILGTQLLGFLHIQQAAWLWCNLPVTVAACCVGSTKTKAMTNRNMPLAMRVMGYFGTMPEISAANDIKLLTVPSALNANGSVLFEPKAYSPESLRLDPAKAARLWDMTGELARQRGIDLP